MNNLLKKITDKKNLLDSYRPLPPELIKNLNEWFIIEQTYTSNALEGNTLTRSETALVVEKGLTIGGKTLKEHLEAINLAHAIEYVQTLTHQTKKDITLQTICDIHHIILRDIDKKSAGTWRKVAVKISGSQATLPDPIKVPELMEQLIDWLHQTKENSVHVATDFHLKLVTIHPFVDGNGRTARLIMNLILIQSGYPPVFIRPENRLEYINNIEKAESTGNMESYYHFMYEQLEHSLDIYLDTIQKSIIKS